jgi:hypothetical protein
MSGTRVAVDLTPAFLAALRIDPVSTRAPGLLRSRLVGLGHGVVCGRCGGTGHHSYNPQHGTVCFGCAGRGQSMPRLTRTLLARVGEQVAAGELDVYLAATRAALRAEQEATGARDRVMAAWQRSVVSGAYRWQDAADQARATRDTGAPLGRDAVIADRFNVPMCAAYDRVSKLHDAHDALVWKRRNGQATDADVEAARVALLEAASAAVAEIDGLAADLAAWLAANPRNS